MIHINLDRVPDPEEQTAVRDTTHKHDFYVQRAAFLAQKSDVVNHKHGCVIVSNRGKILAEGYNTYYRSMSIHAEIDALSKIRRDKLGKQALATASMYVVRIGTEKMGYPLKYSRPCDDCTRAILKAGIGKVYYSTSFDFIMCTNYIPISYQGLKERSLAKQCACCCHHASSSPPSHACGGSSKTRVSTSTT